MHLCLFPGISAATGEKEAAGGLLLSAAGQGNAGEKVCHHPEGADSAGALPGGDKVGGGWESDTGKVVKSGQCNG